MMSKRKSSSSRERNQTMSKKSETTKSKVNTSVTRTTGDINRNKRGRCILYFCVFTAVTSIAWPLSLYRVFDKEIWCPEFVLKLFNSKRNSPQTTHVPHKKDLVWVVDRRSNLSLNEFVQKYDGKRPVLITDALTGWKANKWSKDFFAKNYGDQQVVMKAVRETLNQAESIALPLKLFAKHSGEGSATTWTYIGDELFIQLHPELREHLGVPIYLKEDFFQLFPIEVRPWNAMLLWGTAYSRSYLHIDPYNWTGTNAVFSGKKLWKLYPPGQDEYLYVIPNRSSEFPLNCFKYNSLVDAFSPDLKTYPRFAKARAISFEQKPGELLIIPPGWFHQAFNEVETIAVSSQVMNSQNFHIILEEIFKAGDVDRNNLPRDFYELPAVDQVSIVMKSLSPQVIQRGREVTADILRQMGYPTK